MGLKSNVSCKGCPLSVSFVLARLVETNLVCTLTFMASDMMMIKMMMMMMTAKSWGVRARATHLGNGLPVA